MSWQIGEKKGSLSSPARIDSAPINMVNSNSPRETLLRRDTIDKNSHEGMYGSPSREGTSSQPLIPRREHSVDGGLPALRRDNSSKQLRDHNNNNHHNNNNSTSSNLSKSKNKNDVESLMSRAWDKYYKEGELFVQVVDSSFQGSSKALQDAEMMLILDTKSVTQRWGQSFLVEVEDRSFGEFTLEIYNQSRLNSRKKFGKCKVLLSKLEDGKPVEGWYNLTTNRKGEVKSKGHLKIKIIYTSALTRTKDYCLARDNFQQIMQVLMDKDVLVISTLCKLYKEEDLSMALIRLFNSQKQASSLLMNLLIREIYSHDDMSTLFRRDSMATKTARNFFSLVAKSYLKRHILPFVAYISCDVSKGNCYEVDPAKLEPNSDISTNAGRLLAAARMFLTVILDSCDNLPISVRTFFCNLDALVKTRVKSSSPLGALFFLRFVCPAALFPSQYDLLAKPLEPGIFRALVLVTKILQNLVNGCLFKEEYMTIFNSFITDNLAPINGFFEALCTQPKAHNVMQDDPMTPYTEDELVKLLSIIVRKMHIYFDKIEADIENDYVFANGSDKEHQMNLFNQLKGLFTNQPTIPELEPAKSS